MPSPFPGMNPYLEHPFIWKNFHNSFILELRNQLLKLVRPLGYWVNVEESLYLNEVDREWKPLIGIPDLSVHHTGRLVESRGPAGLATLTEPLTTTIPDVELIEESVSSLQVLNPKGRTVVTAIVVLSTTNKLPSRDREKYVRKRRALLGSDANLVEIDLLRAGPRLLMREAPESEYLILVSRPAERPNASIWPVGLRSALPTIPVPLRDQQSVPIDLQRILAAVYEEAGYEDVCYQNSIKPPLSPADAEWADGLLRAAGITPPAGA